MKTSNAVKTLSGALVATVIAVGTVNAADSIQTELPKPDMMVTPLGLSMAGGKQAWGSTFEISNPGHVVAKGLGVGANLCRFSPVGFRPFNKGLAASGNFKAQVYRNNIPVHTAFFTLGAQSALPGNGWHNFSIELPQGKSQIKIVLDPANSVAESDEGNNVYTVNARVSVACELPGRGAPSMTKNPGARNPAVPGKAIQQQRPAPLFKRQ